MGSNKRVVSPETREKLRVASTKRLADPVERARHSASIKAALARPEVKAKFSEAGKKRWEDPAERARQSAAMKAAWGKVER